MLKIKLINMPFADIRIPSIALTQIKSVTEEMLGSKVKIDIHYLNHNFGKYLTPQHYRFISNGGGSNNSDFGDWFFRQEAFPEQRDNTQEYLARYAQLLGPAYLQRHGNFLLEKRKWLSGFLDELIDVYSLADADVVGFTSMFMQNVASFAMARKIKKSNKDVITIMGGANCETPMGEEIVKNFDFINYAFSGGALIGFPQLLNKMITGDISSSEAINGVFTRSNSIKEEKSKAKILVKADGTVETVGPIGDELPINNCVPLDYDSFLQSYENTFTGIETAKPYLTFETSRGCWWGAKAHCTFCGLNSGGMSYRAVKSDRAIQMLNGLFSRYGNKVKHFSCVDNIIPKEYINEVFPYIKRPQDISIFYEVKADLSSEEMKILAEGGVTEMQPGIEALSTSTLKLMKKGTTSFNNIRFLHDAVIYSISPSWNLLIGFPGEEESIYEKYYQDMPLLHHLPPPGGVFPVRFDRYSPYFNEVEKYKLDLQPLDYYELIYPFSQDVLREMAYYFSDHNFDADYIKATAKWIKPLEKRIDNWTQRWAEIENGIFPKLYFYTEAGRDVIFDSRNEEIKRTPVSPFEKKILQNLTQRKNLEGLLAQTPEANKQELTDALHRVKSYGLLFEENGTYMSLVFDHEPVLTKRNNFH